MLAGRSKRGSAHENHIANNLNAFGSAGGFEAIIRFLSFEIE
jgi:hypothetical protein